jgi:peptidoglycan/LPS O-acetylase OafA/YrhL
MSEAGGKSTGFDYLRIGLALSILSWHSIVTSYGPAVQDQTLASPWRLAIGPILPMFFALSGFLVAGSLQRNTIPTFLGLRILRIVPALAVEVVLSALVLGPLLTTFALGEYFSDTRFLTYFLNVGGYIHYILPGMFEHNPFPLYVNGQLWTIPFELDCYALLAILAIMGVCRRAPVLAIVTLALQFLWAGKAAVAAYAQGEWPRVGSIVPGPVLILSFLAGVTLYMLRDRVPARLPLAAMALALTAIGLAAPFGDYFIAFPIAYLTATIGLLNPPRWSLVRWGDYSYGVFLYGFPIEQFAASLGPGFQHWYIDLAIALPLTLALAALSWTIVERPLLGLKRHVQKLDALSALVQQQTRRVTLAFIGRADTGLD